MGNSWAIPLVFGILFFSTVFSSQDVYGPHYTNFDGIRHHYQGQTQYVSVFDVSILISEGLGNPKKNANFEVCVTLHSASDSFQTEIIAMNLSACQPITVGGQETDLNFLRVLVPVTGDPVFTRSMVADISGFYEIKNPAGKSMTGEIEFLAKEVVLDILACTPPQCSGNDDGTNDGDGCGPNGTCVADDVCKCNDGWHGEFCQVPDCTSNADCDDGDACTLEVCREDGVCAIAPIPECNPNERCETNEQCTAPDECTIGFCNSIGNCQFESIPGCVPQIPCDDPNCEQCLPSNPSFCEQCRDGFTTDANGQCTACDPAAVEVCTDGLDNDCDGSIDFADEECSSAERCDGFDNDADDEIDEGFNLGESCKIGTGSCERAGTIVCDSFGGATCNVSPGTPVEENNQETCTDGIDNDCDGLTDCDDTSCLDADLGVTCSLPLCGDGIRQGDEICDDGTENGNTICGCQADCTFGNANDACDDGFFCTFGDFCDGEGNCRAGGPTCTDGTCDEVNDVCEGGTCDVPNCTQCVSGEPNLCESCEPGFRVDPSGQCSSLTCEPTSDFELCYDNVDNNCDGQIDEGCDCVEGQSRECYSGSPGTQFVGLCRTGVQFCDPISGVYGPCLEEITPSEEMCDERDNDCDGLTDEDDVGGNVCRIVCGDGIFSPPFEECDDGNTADGDGCSAICMLETSADLSMEKILVDDNPNFPIYNLIITNHGPDDAAGVFFIDTFTGGQAARFASVMIGDISLDCSTTGDPTGTTIEAQCDLPDMPFDSSTLVQVSIDNSNGAFILSNTARVFHNAEDPNAENDRDTVGP